MNRFKIVLLGVVTVAVATAIIFIRASATEEQAPPAGAGAEGARVEARPVGQHTYVVTASLPDGRKAETTYSLGARDLALAEEGSTDSPFRDFSLAHELSGRVLRWSYRVVVPAGSFPEGALASGRGSLPLGPFVAVAHAAQDRGVEVVVKGEITEIVKEGVAQLEEHVGKAGNPLTEYGASVMSVSDAWQQKAGFEKMQARLAALRLCASNPTNPLTRKMYREDPEARKRALDEIEVVDLEVRMDTAVRFIAAINSQASSLTGAKWLGFVVGPLTSWADERIASLGEERVRALERSMVSCETSGAWRGTITYSAAGEGTPVVPHGSGTEKYQYEQTTTVVGTSSESPDAVSLRAIASAQGVMQGQSSARVEVHGRCFEDSPRILAELTVHKNEHSHSLAADEEVDVSILLDRASGKYELSFPVIGGEARGTVRNESLYQDNCRGTSTPSSSSDDAPVYFENDTSTVTGTFESTGALPSRISGSASRKQFYQGKDLTITISWDLTRVTSHQNRAQPR